MVTTLEAARMPQHRFNVDEYHRMGETGVLSEDDRVELIEGVVVEMAAMGTRHAGCMRVVDGLLHAQLGNTAVVSSQLPLRIGEYGEPEPDVAVLRWREDRYADVHPTPSDVLLVVEIADTSLAYDRGIKLPMYARAGIPEAVLIDLVTDTIERHTEPSKDGYRVVRRFKRGEVLRSTVLPSLELRVDDVLGRRRGEG